MKTKSIVKTLFWVLFLTCSFQYSLMLPTYAVEQKANNLATTYAAQFPLEQQKTIQQQFVQNYLDNISNESILSIPYLTEFSYNDLKGQQLQLGLDLKGGMQVLLGINKATFLKQLVDPYASSNFEKTLALTNEQVDPTNPNYITVFFDNFQSIEQEENIIRLFLKSALLKETLSVDTELATLKKEVDALLRATLLTTQYQLRERLNSLGLGQPNLTADINKQYLRIEVPGAQNPERIRSIVTTTASLEFWETYRITDEGMVETFMAVDRMLAESAK